MPGSALTETRAGGTAVTIEARADQVSPEQAARGNLPPAQWDDEVLHGYICEEIARRGPQLPCRESMIIASGFRQRFGTEMAARITLAAFGIYGGIWRGAPVSWRRFSAANDEFFGCQIREALGG